MTAESIREHYDALLFVSFGGPEGREDVIPFLENVLRGKNVPHERMMEVAEHYYHFDGISPINQQCRGLISDIAQEFQSNSIDLPIYWGNRNWSPYLVDTLRKMKDDGIQRAIAFFTSLYSSYSGCRQYRENLFDACAEIGEGCPQIDKLRMPYNHPLLIDIQSDALVKELHKIESDDSENTLVLFCAHSIPDAMANFCRYQEQLLETSRLIAEKMPTHTLGTGFPKSQRASNPILVSPRCLRPNRRASHNRKSQKRCDPPDRLCFRSHGSFIRPRS